MALTKSDWRPFKVSRQEVVEDHGAYVVMREYLEPCDNGPVLIRCKEDGSAPVRGTMEYRQLSLQKPTDDGR